MSWHSLSCATCPYGVKLFPRHDAVKFHIDAVSAHSSYPSLPKVDVHYAMREFDGQLVLDSLRNGAHGVIIAGTGSGSVVSGEAKILQAMQEGLIVAVSTRSPNGGRCLARAALRLFQSQLIDTVVPDSCYARALPALSEDGLSALDTGTYCPSAHDRLWVRPIPGQRCF